ncbi:MAG: serine hydrolase [Pontiellaceae bacterium]|jgi:D-alanyl-D-alanine carboxypeptidase (penicillin-binding protein 5/6)|nr:serine hydrolase [Pontiellaceae bacterium]
MTAPFSPKFLILLIPMLGTALCAQALDVRSRDPYYGAVAIDAAAGTILMEDHASAVAYPASMVKLANLFVIFDDIKAGKLRLDEPVTVTREVSQIGGRQVWLKEGEVFPLEELIYAMMIHSANDAAAALAVHASGSRAAHAARMTAKAQVIGLSRTVFHTVHGLPPSTGQEPDVTSALDMARLAKALLEKHPETLKYSSIETRPFRPNTTNMVLSTSSNKLLGKVPGCDGLKTGYFLSGGFSITATAQRNGRRVIVVILGSRDKNVRDAKAAEWIETGFARLPPPPPPPPAVAEPAVESPPVPQEVPAAPSVPRNHDVLLPVLILVPVAAAVLIAWFVRRRRRA